MDLKVLSYDNIHAFRQRLAHFDSKFQMNENLH